MKHVPPANRKPIHHRNDWLGDLPYQPMQMCNLQSRHARFVLIPTFTAHTDITPRTKITIRSGKNRDSNFRVVPSFQERLSHFIDRQRPKRVKNIGAIYSYKSYVLFFLVDYVLEIQFATTPGVILTSFRFLRGHFDSTAFKLTPRISTWRFHLVNTGGFLGVLRLYVLPIRGMNLEGGRRIDRT